MKIRLPLFAALVQLSCAHTRDEELTAAEHRNEAEILTADASLERARFDPNRSGPPSHRAPAMDADAWDAQRYNPTASHLNLADREMRQAAEHLDAARWLEASEDARCRPIPKEQRGACPLFASSVREVDETGQGIMLQLRDTADVVDIFRRLDCHLAYAVANGFARPSCPLFVKGMTLALQLEPRRAIVMSGRDDAVADEIRKQARRVFLGDQWITAPAP